MFAQPFRTKVPKSDDEGAVQFLANRCLNPGLRWIPCPWSALRRISSQADIRELSLSVLFLMQEMSFTHFGGKFSNFRDDMGNPKVSWDICFQNRSIETVRTFVYRTAHICFRFIHVFNLLHTRFTQSVAVNLLDGMVMDSDGFADLLHNFVTFLSRNGENARNMSHLIEHCTDLLESDSQFSIDDDVCATGFEKGDLGKLEIENVFVSRKGGAVLMERDPIIMLKLASMGYIWNTDMESESLLDVVGPEKKTQIGVWRPLSRDERNSLTDAVDDNGCFRITGTSIWARRAWASHSLMRAQALFHRSDDERSTTVRYIPMPSCELRELDSFVANTYIWHVQNQEIWARELHGQFQEMKSMGYNSKHEEVARWVVLARIRALDKFGCCDGIFDMLFGPINTTFSFACEPASWKSFAELHLARCLRVIGVKTTIEGVPLYEWQRRPGNESPVTALAEKAWRLEPILASRQGSQCPTIEAGWDGSVLWG